MSKNRKKKSYSIKYKEALKVWREETGIKLTPPGVLVMKILIEHANNQTGLAFPSTENIMIESELSKSSVFRALDHLEKIGLIERGKRPSSCGFQRNEYKILLNVSRSLDEEDFPEYLNWGSNSGDDFQY